MHVFICNVLCLCWVGLVVSTRPAFVGFAHKNIYAGQNLWCMSRMNPLCTQALFSAVQAQGTFIQSHYVWIERWDVRCHKCSQGMNEDLNAIGPGLMSAATVCCLDLKKATSVVSFMVHVFFNATFPFQRCVCPFQSIYCMGFLSHAFYFFFFFFLTICAIRFEIVKKD